MLESLPAFGNVRRATSDSTSDNRHAYSERQAPRHHTQRHAANRHGRNRRLQASLRVEEPLSGFERGRD
jgi:hypothetical protein